MIPVQTIVDLMKFELDSEGSDRYLFDIDFKPAINSAIDWLVFVFNRSFENNRFSGEHLTDLVRTRVWVANNFSRIKFDVTGVTDGLWSYLGIHPEPVVFPTGSIPPALPNDYTSLFAPTVSFVESEHTAKLISLEKWNENQKNIFEAGNKILTQNGLKSYGYRNIADYSATTNYLENNEIEIRPYVPGQFVALTYLKTPIKVNLITDSVEFPASVSTLMVRKALNFLSTKQGDQTTLFAITEKDVNSLLKLIN